MKSFKWVINPKYLSGYYVKTPFEIRCYYDGRKIIDVDAPVTLLRIMGIVSWNRVLDECDDEAKRLYEIDLAKVDLTPADHCEHSDLVQDI